MGELHIIPLCGDEMRVVRMLDIGINLIFDQDVTGCNGIENDL